MPTKALWEIHMNKAILAAAAAIAALGLAPAANATVVEGITLSSSKVFDHFEGKSASAGLGLTDSFAFTLDVDSFFTSAILNSVAGAGGDLDFVSVDFDGVHAFGVVNGFFDLAAVAGVYLAAGAHTLNVTYNATAANVTYSGDISISPVPEPATWAMMVAGIAAVGMTMRRRSHTARVAFS